MAAGDVFACKRMRRPIMMSIRMPMMGEIGWLRGALQIE